MLMNFKIFIINHRANKPNVSNLQPRTSGYTFVEAPSAKWEESTRLQRIPTRNVLLPSSKGIIHYHPLDAINCLSEEIW